MNKILKFDLTRKYEKKLFSGAQKYGKCFAYKKANCKCEWNILMAIIIHKSYLGLFNNNETKK